MQQHVNDLMNARSAFPPDEELHCYVSEDLFQHLRKYEMLTHRQDGEVMFMGMVLLPPDSPEDLGGGHWQCFRPIAALS